MRSHKAETVYLLSGSNQGNSLEILGRIPEQLAEAGNVTTKSSMYKTKAWGKTDQPDFFNQAIELHTELSPHELLKFCKALETKLGRTETIKWGPRTADIDILFFGNKIIQTEALTVPHPRLHERKFALTPLHEIAPGLIHPILKKTITQLLKECEDSLEVQKLD